MLASDFFTSARLQEMRDDICREGFVADKHLANNPDCAVFGLNVACLYPFPAEVAEAYEALAARLSALDSGVYVYPRWETHVTIATLVNFTKHERPTAERITELRELTHQVAAELEPAFRDIGPFELSIEQPLISRKAAILPLSDPADAISRIRNQLVAILARNPSLVACLADLGMSIPPLAHSTIMRFKSVPVDTARFLSKFDEISRTAPRATMRVDEIYITTETKPYMREGEIFRRFPI